MVKIPNLGELAEKADVAGMLNKVKTMINAAASAGQPASAVLANANEETLRGKVIELEAVMKQAKELQSQQAALINTLENKLNEMAAIVATIKAPPVIVTPEAAPVVTEPTVSPTSESSNNTESK